MDDGPCAQCQRRINVGITTKDLARMCGVSRTTIHRALNGEGRIHPDTKEMILRVAKENDYRPDFLARGLVKGKTGNIGIVVLDVKNRYFSQMLSVIGAEVGDRGCCMNIMLHNNDRNREREQMMRLASYRMDGIILSSVNEGEEYRDFLKSLQVPIVSVDNRIADGIPFVGIDQRSAMHTAAEYVIKHGYRKIVYVCPSYGESSEQNRYVHRERIEGFKEALRDYPQIAPEFLLDWEKMEQISERFPLDSRTAFLCAADSFALEVMKIQRKAGREPVRDYGIMGFDDIDTLDYVSPRLCTVSNSVHAVAITATETLFQMIESKDGGRADSQLLPFALVDGETLNTFDME